MLSIIKLRLLRLRDDYLVILVMTAMTFGLTAVFGAANVDEYRPRVLVIDEDASRYSQLIVEELKKDYTFQYEKNDYNSARKLVDEGRALTAIVLDKGFGKSIAVGEKPSIGILKIKDDRFIFILENLISSISNRMIRNIEISEITSDYITMYKDVDREKLVNKTYLMAKEAWNYKKPIEVKMERIDMEGEWNYNHLQHITIGFAIFFSTYVTVFSIGTILDDRKYNTWQRMLISPVSKASLLGGSMIAAYFISAIQLGVLILGGGYIFGMDWGPSISGIILIAAGFVFAMTCFGLFLSGIVKTHAQLAAITPVVLTSTAMLGGCMWPLEIINSKVLLGIANLTPHKWAVEGMKKIAVHGYGFEAAIMPSLILTGMGIIFLAVGVRLVKFE